MIHLSLCACGAGLIVLVSVFMATRPRNARAGDDGATRPRRCQDAVQHHHTAAEDELAALLEVLRND